MLGDVMEKAHLIMHIIYTLLAPHPYIHKMKGIFPTVSPLKVGNA